MDPEAMVRKEAREWHAAQLRRLYIRMRKHRIEATEKQMELEEKYEKFANMTDVQIEEYYIMTVNTEQYT